MSTYQKELDEWMSQSDSFDKSILNVEDILELEIGSEHFPNSFGMFGDMNILIMDAQNWKAADAQKALSLYEDIPAEVRVGLVFAGGEPSKNTIKFATEPLRERYIPLDEDGMTQWIVDWLDDRDFKIKKSEARDIAAHVSFDADALVRGLQSLISSDANRSIDDASRVMYMFGAPKGGDGIELSKYIIAGNKKGVTEEWFRLKNESGDNLIGVMYMITNSLRAYCALAYDPDVNLDQFGIYGGRQYYVRQEARSINKSKALKITEIVSRADSRIFGGSSLSFSDVLLEMSLAACKVFAR